MKNETKKQVVLAMYRSNPQLGDYCTLEITDIVRATKTALSIDWYGTTKSFDVFGKEKKPNKAVYGEVMYRIFSFDAAKEKHDGEKFDGFRISRGKEVFNVIGL